MKMITQTASRALAGLLLLGAGTLAGSAQTFLYDGVVYKVASGKATAQKATVAPANGEAPGQYAGDIVVPQNVSYEGKEYPVTSIAAVFKGEPITSIELPSGNDLTISRGCFQGCTELKTCVLPSDLSKFNGNIFTDCTALESISIPGSVPEIPASVFSGCTALKTLIIEDGEVALEWQTSSFGTACTAENVTINRAIGSKYSDMSQKPFRLNSYVKNVTIGGSCTSLPASYFEGASNLESITFTNDFTSFDTNVFASTAFTEFTVPAGVTSISGSLFMGCPNLKKVVLPEGLTSIGAMAFYNTKIQDINFPSTLTSISSLAFSGSDLQGDIVVPEGVKTVGDQAFANNEAITSVSLPATLTSLGSGAFLGCTALKELAVAAENETYKAADDKSYITDAEGTSLEAYAAAATATEFTGNFTNVANYAFYGAKNLKSVNLPACQAWGDYALYGSGITSLSLSGSVGRYTAANCADLTSLTVSTAEVPFGVAADCPNLEEVVLTRPVSVVKQDAFKNCAKVKSLDLGNILAILETDCFAGCGVEALTVGAFYPAAMAEGVFTAESNITVTVPESLVDTYKAATGWSYLTIKGDANLAVGGENMGMPAGLYYAGDDNDLHCVYEQGGEDVYPMGLQHTFQLAQFANRIYGASAGKKFWYSLTSAVEGEGKLFYISKVGDEIFQAVVLDNNGNNAYKDPTGLYIYGNDLYVNDRNVCIRKISADAIALPQDYPSWMENNWMPFYENPWTYGCIKNGFAITQDVDAEGNPEPLFWVGMKYNGEGLYSFKERNIGTDSSNKGPEEGVNRYLTSLKPIATAFNIDEKNGDLYIYIETAGPSETKCIKGGLYRIKLEDLKFTPDPTFEQFEIDLGAQLIDGSPVKYEGNATNEHVGISQLAIDENNEYLYWCYRAPTAEEAEKQQSGDWATTRKGAYWWADDYDENNPLHHSGIKRIKLGETKPEVEMVVEGVTGYGIVPVNFAGSKKPDGVHSTIAAPAEASLLIAAGNSYVAAEACNVALFNAAGAMVATQQLAAGEAFSTENLAAGLYILEARAGQAKQAVKVVK